MKVVRKVKPLMFTEDGNELHVHYDNRGEPYREGVSLTFYLADDKTSVQVMLSAEEVYALRNKLNEFIGQAPTPK